MMEQSLIILQVTMELEEYARKARKITLTRTGRARGGMVTPPTAPAFGRGLFTYDDKFDIVEHSPAEKRESNGSNASFSIAAIITDGNDSFFIEDEPALSETKAVATQGAYGPSRAVLCLIKWTKPLAPNSTRPFSITKLANVLGKHLLRTRPYELCD
jgi:hypothetical protein